MPNFQPWVTSPTSEGPETAHRALSFDVRFRNDGTKRLPGIPIPFPVGSIFGSVRRVTLPNEIGTMHLKAGVHDVQQINLPSGWNSQLFVGIPGYIDPTTGEWSGTDTGGTPVVVLPHPNCVSAFNDVGLGSVAGAGPDDTFVLVGLVSKGDHS